MAAPDWLLRTGEYSCGAQNADYNRIGCGDWYEIRDRLCGRLFEQKCKTISRGRGGARCLLRGAGVVATCIVRVVSDQSEIF
jgi:hypothetical protein